MSNNVTGQPQNVQVPNYSGVNIQIFNPSVTASDTAAPQMSVATPNYSTTNTQSYPSNYYTQNLAQSAPTKTERKEIVELTDNYIMTLESYLNNPKNTEERLMAAKEVISRLEEDSTRKDDPALNALINKMLQDPYSPIKSIALSALEARIATGNQKSVMLLLNIKNSNDNNGLDSIQASNALLKMSSVKGTREVTVPINNSTQNKKA